MTRTYAETNRIYSALYDLKDALGPNANRRDRAVMMIGACILHGFDTRHEIIKSLKAMGLAVDHVRTILDEQTGTAPGLDLWRCDEDGRYHLLDPG